MGSLIKRGAAAPAAATTAARGGSSARFQYKPRSAEEVKAHANRAIGARDSYIKPEVDFFTPSAGDNNVRMLPPTWDGARHYGHDLFLHYSIGPDKNAYLCLDKMKGEPCPICEERTRAAGAEEAELAKMLRPKQRVLTWIIDRKQEGKGPLVWSMPAGLDKDIVNCSIDKGTGEVLSLDDPSEKGFDVYFKRVGLDEKTEYTGVQVARQARPLSDNDAAANKWLDYIATNALPSLLQYRTYEEIKAAYAGTTTERKEPAADGGKRVPRRSATAAASAQPAAAAPAAAAAAPAEQVTITWDEVHALDEAALEGLINDLGMDATKENFTSEQQIQDWVCAQLGLQRPAVAPAAAAGDSWQERLAKMRGGK